MDTRGRKRKRGRRAKEDVVPVVQLEDILLEEKTASIPQFSPRESRDVSSPSQSSVASSAFPPESDPRRFSSCSRLVRSPSPARLCRQREHTEMQTLNERLSSHADHVKQLQAENSRLRLQLEAMDDVIQRESSNMKLLHGSEIRNLQDLIDTCNEEKAAISTLHEEEKLERERLGAQLWDKDAEIASLCEQLDALKAVSEEYRKLRIEFEAAEAASVESRQDADRMREELLKEKRCNRRLEQEASANKERYLREVEEASARFSEHMQQADQKLEEGYEAMVDSALTGLRQQHIRDLEGLKAEMTTNYQSKLSEWKSACELAQADLLTSRRECKTARQEQDRLRDLVTKFKADKAALGVQVQETQTRLDEVRDRAERDRCQAQREVALLTQELAEQREELEEMGGANSRLEAEINAYRLIVEDLEGQKPKALNSKSEKVGNFTELKPKDRKKKRTKEISSMRKLKTKSEDDAFDIFKRKDYIRTNDFSQGIEILDIDVCGRYITLVNTTDHPTDLCLWTVQQTDGQNNVKYELGASTQLARGKRLTLWSCDAGPAEWIGGQGAPGSNLRSDIAKDGNGDVGDASVGGDEGGNLDVTMVGRAWLKLDQSLTVRVEDGDGQLQAKCDISNAVEKGLSEADNSNASNTIFATTTTSSTPSSTASATNASSCNKRPRLGGINHSSSSNSSKISTSSSDTRFNNNSNSSKQSAFLRPGIPGKDRLKAVSPGCSSATVAVVTSGKPSEMLSRHHTDKDSCLVM